MSFSYIPIFCKQVNTGYFLISFCLGNSSFPLRDCLAHHMKPHRHFFLTDPFFFPVFSYIIVDHIFSSSRLKMQYRKYLSAPIHSPCTLMVYKKEKNYKQRNLTSRDFGDFLIYNGYTFIRRINPSSVSSASTAQTGTINSPY